MKAPRRRRLHEVHVYRESDSARWIVASGHRALSRHREQHTAVSKATRVARSRRVDLVVHGRDGRFRSKNSYGNETRRGDT